MTTQPTEAPKPLKLFYCYARKDKAYRDELDAHLSGLKRSHQIASWSDREISPGVEWETAIDKELNTAHIILLLVSASFMASDYCYGIEMKRALERHEAEQARVVPILLRAVDWEDAPFSKLQALPSNATPISRWHDRDDAYEDITKGLRKVVRELQVLLKTKEDWLSDGDNLYNNKHYDEAIRAYDQALRLDPSYTAAYYNKGAAYYELKQYDEALLICNHIISLNPNDPNAYHAKGRVLDDLHRFDEALLAYDQAIRLNPNYVDAHQNKGLTLGALQRFKEALAAFDQAIRLDPNLALAHYNKGVALQHLNKQSEARTAFQRAKELGYPVQI